MEEILKNPLPIVADATTADATQRPQQKSQQPRKVSFSILRVPFLLEPQYDEDLPHVETNRQRLIKKWGGPEGWETQKRRHDLKGRGRDAGIPHFNLDRLASNTMASHRLIQHVSRTYGLETSESLYDRLNVYYFVEGHSLNDRPRLANVAARELERVLRGRTHTHEDDEDGEDGRRSVRISSGQQQQQQPQPPPPPSEEQLLAFLNGQEGREEIESALYALSDLGIHGIPKFIIEGTTVVDGAAHSDVFIEIFREIERRGTVRGGPIFGEILKVDHPDVTTMTIGTGGE